MADHRAEIQNQPRQEAGYHSLDSDGQCYSVILTVLVVRVQLKCDDTG